MIRTGQLPDSHLFSHEAMNTTFHLRIVADREPVARGMARECFDHVDYLETRLSRFLDGSDISRVNHMQAGETLYLSEAGHACLLLALHVHARTRGLFDITIGTRIAHRKAGDNTPAPPLAGNLIIHPDAPAITCESPGREIDLGGIGKGFALDQMMALLIDWGADGALLSAGASTLLCFGGQAWPVDLSGDSGSQRISLTNRALSASGTGILGSHIVHPLDVARTEKYLGKRVWVVAPAAALSDAWSTAVMLMDRRDVMEILSGEDDILAVYAETGGNVECISSTPCDPA